LVCGGKAGTHEGQSSKPKNGRRARPGRCKTVASKQEKKGCRVRDAKDLGGVGGGGEDWKLGKGDANPGPEVEEGKKRGGSSYARSATMGSWE